MNLDALREQVLEGNLELVRRGLVLHTFGNASGIDRASGLVASKPSGVPYHGMKPSDMVVMNLEGAVVEGSLRPSSDLATHLTLYRAPFTWGESVAAAAHHARVLEEIAQTALHTLAVNPAAEPISQALLDKHFFQKHGSNAYYGQAK